MACYEPGSYHADHCAVLTIFQSVTDTVADYIADSLFSSASNVCAIFFTS